MLTYDTIRWNHLAEVASLLYRTPLGKQFDGDFEMRFVASMRLFPRRMHAEEMTLLRLIADRASQEAETPIAEVAG